VAAATEILCFLARRSLFAGLAEKSLIFVAEFAENLWFYAGLLLLGPQMLGKNDF
jgi:hypothetical protein